MDEYNKYCRLCLYQSEESVSIFEGGNNILVELSTCLSIEITSDDLLPKTICNKCANLLHEYYIFFTRAKYCEEALISYLKNDVSLENNWISEDNQQAVSQQTIQNDELNSPCESEFLAEFLDDSNNSFDLDLLTSDSNALNTLENLGDENQTSTKVGNKLINSGFKVTKITNFRKNNNPNPTDDCYEIHMEIDVLDSDLDVVNQLLSKKIPISPLPALKNAQDDNHLENYSCMSCKSVFNHFDSLADHMGKCDVLCRTCLKCRKVFETKAQMLKHKSTHSSIHMYNCLKCTKQFLDQDRLDRHMEQSHGDFTSDTSCIYRCRECGKLFETRVGLYKHAKSHVKTTNTVKSKIFTCEDCGDSYLNKMTLINHRKQRHGIFNTVPVVFRCRACTAIFRDKKRLYRHVQSMHLPRGSPHLCDTCGNSFNSYNALSRHVLIHVGNQFQCDICSRQYMNRTLLEKHLLTHKADTKMCEVCGVICANEVLLNLHYEKHSKKPNQM